MSDSSASEVEPGETGNVSTLGKTLRNRANALFGLLTFVAAGCAVVGGDDGAMQPKKSQSELAVDAAGIVAGMTDYSLFARDDFAAILQSYKNAGFNYVRFDAAGPALPHLDDSWDQMNPIWFDRLRSVVVAASDLGVVLQISPKLAVFNPTSAHNREVHRDWLAVAVAGYENNIVWEADLETCQISLPDCTVGAIDDEVIKLKQISPYVGIHGRRNSRYDGQSSWPFTEGAFDNLNSADPTIQLLHEGGKIDGSGVQAAVAQGDAVIVSEVFFEDTGTSYTGPCGGVGTASNYPFGSHDYAIVDEVYNSGGTDKYYRWYTMSALLSGARGLQYGTRGPLPGGGSGRGSGWYGAGCGYNGQMRVVNLMRSKGFNPQGSSPNDGNCTNGYSDWHKAKCSSAGGYRYTYNPMGDTITSVYNVSADRRVEVYNLTDGSLRSTDCTSGSRYSTSAGSDILVVIGGRCSGKRR